MEFLNPAALYGLAALPLLLIPYLIRRKPRPMLFSSLLLLAQSAGQPNAQTWGRLRLPPVFFLQLLLLTLLILALADPVFITQPSNIAIVLDNSASMQTFEGKTSRFALAQEKAQAVLAGVSANGRIDIYLTTPSLTRLGGAAVTPREAASVISGLEAYDIGDPAVDYKNILGHLMQDQKYEEIVLITDHPSRPRSGAIHAITVGTAQANMALKSFQVRRSSLTNASLEANIEVSNFSAQDERIKVTLRGGGTPLANRELVVGAGKSAAITMAGIPAHPYYEAAISAAHDALPLDNRRFAVAPTTANLRILGVSPRPQELASLRAIPGVNLDLIAPSEYENAETSRYGLEIFHFAAPATLPHTSTLLVLPPKSGESVELGTAVSRPIISGWREPHELTRYVNFTLFRPSYARPLKAQVPSEVIIESPQGPLALALEHQGTRHLVLGFDPFPYLGRDNLPMSIFTLNLIDWFFGHSSANGQATGDPLAVNAQQTNELATPKGKKILNPGAKFFPETYYQGIYQIPRGTDKELVAINFQDANESDLRNPIAVDIGGAAAAGGRLSALASYWPYLLLTVLGLLLLEWFVNPRWPATRRRRFGRQGIA